jgi:purine-binding chemotaxis protein CheW
MTANENSFYKNDDLFEEEEDSQKDKYLTFQMAEVEYGIDIRYVTEIVGIQKITEVPDLPDFIKGVINLRGKVIPIMDVRQRFQLPLRDYDSRTCIIVIQINDSNIGLVVDEVREVANIPESQIDPPPNSLKGAGRSFFQGIGKIADEVKIILDIKQLLFDDELEQLGEAA